MTRIASRFAPEPPVPHSGDDAPAAESGKPTAALVARCRAGDPAAQRLLYVQHVHSVNERAVRLLGRTADAEDVVQDAFVAAFTRIHQLRDDTLFSAWLLRITVHEVHRRFRRRRLLAALGMARGGEDDAGLASQAAPGLPAEAQAELRLLDRALAQLPARERIAWMLRHIEGLELTEVASACNTSLATIKRWLARADEHVRGHLNEESNHG